MYIFINSGDLSLVTLSLFIYLKWGNGFLILKINKIAK